MMPISGINTGAVQPLAAAEKVPGASKIQKEEEEVRPLKPTMDEYVPEEPREPSGRYWLGKDGDGRPKIHFDDPERTADAPQKPDGDIPEEEPGPADQAGKGPEKKEEKEERWECNTDKVDREIEKLRKKQQELEQRLSTETDEAKIKDLERQLAQVERELTQKDNDAYRRQHSSLTRLS